jgi:Heterokaryon incompatibility protein (HET)
MRLLTIDSRGELGLTEDLLDNIPPYAILSHTWGADHDEVTFDDLRNGLNKSRAGYAKIRFCGEQARKDKIDYFWVDTCCINKANHAELSEAITSMFRWYRDALKCYVYLPDVSAPKRDNNGQTQRTWESAFRASRWFTRGWTLQELLAPGSVEFFSREEELLGDKKMLEQEIHEITDIPITALHGTSLSHFPVDERLRWAAKRDTKRKEDKAYCLLGIFDIFMPLIYGEGDNAFIRLKKKINKPCSEKNFPVICPEKADFPRFASATLPRALDSDATYQPHVHRTRSSPSRARQHCP